MTKISPDTFGPDPFANPIINTERVADMRIHAPAKSDWQCYIAGDQISIRPDVGKVPNWFHRQMHRLFFGARWVRDKD